MKHLMSKHKALIITVAVILLIGIVGVGILAIKSSEVKELDTYIGKETAKSKLLEEFGLTSDMGRFTKVKLDRDDGRVFYELEFKTSDRVYEADIEATTGEIFEKDIDIRERSIFDFF